MPGSRSAARLLARHRPALADELRRRPNLLTALAARGVLDIDEAERFGALPPGEAAEALSESLANRGANAFRELCVALERESPHLLTTLLLDGGSGGQHGERSDFNADPSTAPAWPAL